MNLPERRLTHREAQTQSTQPTPPTPKSRTFKAMLRLALPGIFIAAFLNVPFGPHVLAQSTAQANSDDTPTIDPAAMDALNKMGAYLRTVKSFQVTSDVTNDDVLDDGQDIQSSSKVDAVIARPDRMRVQITDDNGSRFFFFNGKVFTVFQQASNYYATVPAPATIGELMDVLSDKYGIDLPLRDLYEWGNNDEDIKKIKSAVDIGPTIINGITCEQYAFRQEGIDWQLWIELGDFPLPLKLVIRTLTDDAKPQHSNTITWNLAPSFSDDAFTFTPPEGAQRIPLEQLKPTSDGQNK